jgi:DNA-directed RNA polymerase subunit RPC12/RpoP
MSAALMRARARDAIARAKVLLAQNDVHSLRYACLELRFAIEYVCYQNLYAYVEEVGDDASKRWQPREVIAVMKSADPQADKPSKIAFGREEVYGEPPSTMTMLGEDRRFSARWANTNHSALGNFLHAPTVHAIETGAEVTEDTIRQKAESIIQTLDETLATTIFNVRFGQFFEFDCDCGRKIKRAEGSFDAKDGIMCPSCSATYDPIEVPGSNGTQYQFALRGGRYTCSYCNRQAFVGEHDLVRDKVLVCECGAQHRIAMAIEPLAPAPGDRSLSTASDAAQPGTA